MLNDTTGYHSITVFNIYITMHLLMVTLALCNVVLMLCCIHTVLCCTVNRAHCSRYYRAWHVSWIICLRLQEYLLQSKYKLEIIYGSVT